LIFIDAKYKKHILKNKGKNIFKILKVTENSENHLQQQQQQQQNVIASVENVQDFNQLNFSLERVEDQQQQQQHEQQVQQQDQVGVEMSGEPTLDQLTTSNAVITTNTNENNKDDLALLDGDGLDGDGSSPQHHLGEIDDPNDTSLKDIDDTLDFGNVSHQQGDGKY
jgi:hypothetical protein